MSTLPPLRTPSASPSPTRFAWETMMGAVQVEVDEQHFVVSAPGARTERPWTVVTGAGILQQAQSTAQGPVPADVWKEIGRFLPGLGRILRINDTLADDYRQIVIGCGSRYGEIVRIPFALGTEDALALVELLRGRLGPLWKGDLQQGDYHKELGARFPWWGVPLSILFLLVLAYAVSFTCVGLYAVSEGDLSLLREWYLWPGFVIWFGIVGSILWLYRRRR